MYEREAAAAAATYATGTGIGTSPGERLSFYACMRGIEERHKAAGAVRCCGVENTKCLVAFLRRAFLKEHARTA